MKSKNAEKRPNFIQKNIAKRIILVAVILALIFVAFRLLLLFFSVGNFEIEGDTKYSINDIVNAAGIRKGDRLYYVDEDEVEERLLKKCPHIKNVSVECDFPDTVRFVIEERGLGWYLQVEDDFLVLDYDLKVLTETSNEKELINRSLTKLELPELEVSVVGYFPEFGNGDERLISETIKIIDRIRNCPIKDRMTYLDLEQRFEIKMVIDSTYEVYFGDMEDAETKFEMICKVIEDSKAKGYVGGKITFTGPTDPAFRGYFADELPDNEADGEKE